MSYQEQTTPNQTVAPMRDERLATHDLYETAAADPSLGILLDLLKAADLELLLRGPDLLTVLAPVNEAFGEWERRVESAPLYILHGASTIDELRASGSVKTLQGKSLKVTGDDREVRVGGARVIRADIECTNGVIHVIDSLLDGNEGPPEPR